MTYPQPKFITDVQVLLERHARNEAIPELTNEIINNFSENCKTILTKMRDGREKNDFKLYFSNLGQDARKLWLEKNHGRPPMDAFTTLKMKFGDMAEQLMMALLVASGANVTDIDKEVEYTIKGVKIKGRMDLKIDNKVVDIKTASTYSYDMKFESLSTLQVKDDFGYCGQLIGYSLADGESKAGGWLVIDKVTGAFKFVDAAPLNALKPIQDTIKDIEYKIGVLNGTKPVPTCTNVVDEYFNKKLTGKKVLGTGCNYCSHKEVCHPTIQYKPVEESKASNPPYKFYIVE